MAEWAYTTPPLAESPPPRPSPTKGGGSSVAFITIFPHTHLSAGYTRRTTSLSPPPWWGRVRVGGNRFWFQKRHGACVKPRPTLKYGSGRDYAISNWMATGSAGSTLWDVMWWIASVCPKDSSSRLMAGSMPAKSKRTMSERGFSKKKVFALFGSGTMTCCATRKALSNSFEVCWLERVNSSPSCHPPTSGFPPTLTLPHEGGGGKYAAAACCRDRDQFPPPWWGRVRVGGAPLAASGSASGHSHA